MSDRRDRVREKVAIEILKALKAAMGFGEYKDGHWELMTQVERDIYLEMAGQILSLDDGKMIAVLDEDQEYMDIPDPDPHGYEGESEAISSTENSQLVRKALGDHVFDSFIKNKKIEWDQYRIQVTEYELKKYLPML